jgi:hypothetical protein
MERLFTLPQAAANMMMWQITPAACIDSEEPEDRWISSMVQVDFLLAKIQVRASLKYSMALVGLTLSRHAA